MPGDYSPPCSGKRGKKIYPMITNLPLPLPEGEREGVEATRHR
jgi:hypothetical protein